MQRGSITVTPTAQIPVPHLTLLCFAIAYADTCTYRMGTKLNPAMLVHAFAFWYVRGCESDYSSKVLKIPDLWISYEILVALCQLLWLSIAGMP